MLGKKGKGRRRKHTEDCDDDDQEGGNGVGACHLSGRVSLVRWVAVSINGGLSDEFFLVDM